MGKYYTQHWLKAFLQYDTQQFMEVYTITSM